MHTWGRWMVQAALAAFLLAAGPGWAAPEPTINQVYATAQAGRLDEAQVMVQQVLLSHPTSAKAFYVQAELYARQGDLTHARKSLASAEKFAPGLPFAKPESVQALRAQLQAVPADRVTPAQAPSPAPMPVSERSPSSAQPASSSWLLPVLLAMGVVLAGYVLFRRRAPAPGYAVPDAMGPAAGMAYPPSPNYPPGSYPQSPPGLGGRIAGGVATGLAVGAGVLAAEAIGRRLMGDDGSAHAASGASVGSGHDASTPLAGNEDLGGNDFGISDAGSWDSGGDAGGASGDW